MAEAVSGIGLSRRALLKIGTLAGGGLVLSLAWPASAQPPTSEASPEQASSPHSDTASELIPNAWVRIHGDGRIQLMLARSEMGQGVMTSLPMLLAEELDVGLDQIQLEQAPVDSLYVNHYLGEQATGESTSIRDAWMPLREAGAVVRMLMLAAAAATWGVPEVECSVKRGRIYHADNVRSLSYGELASKAAQLPLSLQMSLKPKDAWRLIGTAQRRLDTPDKVLGAAAFGLDIRLPGMLFATIERCPVFRSRVSHWQADASRQVPGVVAVLAVRYGIAVIGESTWAALRGRERLDVTCRPKTDPRVQTDRIRSRLRIGLKGRAAVARKEGNVSLALESSAREIDAVYEVAFQAHACMEPMNCTADVRSDGCDIYVPTQAQQAARETTARVTGLSLERIRVHTTFLGGGYGRRREQDFVVDAVELSMMLKRPVQVVWTREDDLRHDYYRPMTLHRLRAGLDADAKPVAWFHRIVGPSVLARLDPSRIRDGIDPIMVAGAADIPYQIPHLRVELRRADTPVPVGVWRGGGYSHNSFVTECFLDELARAAGADPLDMRRALLGDRPRHLRLLDQILGRAGWGESAPDGRAKGLAMVDAFGSLLATVAEVSVDGGGIRVHRVVCVLDCGQVVNPDTVRGQIQGGIAFGLTAALKGEITLADGRVEQGGFKDYPLLRMDEMPEVDVFVLESDAEPGGVSGLSTPSIAPAVANALFALTGTPVRRLPIRLD